jgi:hypothetical protein
MQASGSNSVSPSPLLLCCSQRAFPAGTAGTAARYSCILDHDVAGDGLTWTLRASTEPNLLDFCAVVASAQRALVSRVL